MEKELNEKLDAIHKLLMGNGKIGVTEMARRAFEYMQHQDKTRNGLWDWGFRAVILIFISFIAVRVGLK